MVLTYKTKRRNKPVYFRFSIVTAYFMKGNNERGTIIRVREGILQLALCSEGLCSSVGAAVGAVSVWPSGLDCRHSFKIALRAKVSMVGKAYG